MSVRGATKWNTTDQSDGTCRGVQMSVRGATKWDTADQSDRACRWVCLSEERHAERRKQHDLYVVNKEKNSCDNCHRRDFSVDPRYKLTFTVVSNEEIRTCKLATVKHDVCMIEQYFSHCVRNVNAALSRLQIIRPWLHLRRRTCLTGKTSGLRFYRTF